MIRLNPTWQPLDSDWTGFAASLDLDFSLDTTFNISVESTVDNKPKPIRAKYAFIENISNQNNAVYSYGAFSFIIPAFTRKRFVIPLNINYISVSCSSGNCKVVISNNPDLAADETDQLSLNSNLLSVMPYNYLLIGPSVDYNASSVENGNFYEWQLNAISNVFILPPISDLNNKNGFVIRLKVTNILGVGLGVSLKIKAGFGITDKIENYWDDGTNHLMDVGDGSDITFVSDGNGWRLINSIIKTKVGICSVNIGNSGTISHDLVPSTRQGFDTILVEYVAKVVNNGYSINDRASSMLARHTASSKNGSAGNITVVTDGVTVGSCVNKGTFAVFNFTAANWTIHFVGIITF